MNYDKISKAYASLQQQLESVKPINTNNVVDFQVSFKKILLTVKLILIYQLLRVCVESDIRFKTVANLHMEIL